MQVSTTISSTEYKINKRSTGWTKQAREKKKHGKKVRSKAAFVLPLTHKVRCKMFAQKDPNPEDLKTFSSLFLP